MVRIAPREVSFASPAAVRDIYLGVDVSRYRQQQQQQQSSSTLTAAASTTTKEKLPASAAHNGGVSKDNQRITTGSDASKTGVSSNSSSSSGSSIIRTFPKSAAYDNFGRKGAFQMRDEAEHRERARRIAHVFAPSLLMDMQPLMRAEVANLVHALEARRGAVVDVLYWSRMVALDIVGKSY